MRKLVVVLVIALTTLVSCSEEDKTLEMLNSELKAKFELEDGFKISSYTLEEVPTKDEIEFEMIAFYEDKLTELEMERDKAKRKGQTGAWKIYQKAYRKYKAELDELNTKLEEHPITLRYTIKVFLPSEGRDFTRIVNIRK